PFSRRPRKGGSVTANDEGRAGLETADREDGEESRRGSPLHLVFHRRKRNSSSRKPARFCRGKHSCSHSSQFLQSTNCLYQQKQRYIQQHNEVKLSALGMANIHSSLLLVPPVIYA
ncbi:unnamed protein product, partial [Brassica oleracea var. botrytis]